MNAEPHIIRKNLAGDELEPDGASSEKEQEELLNINAKYSEKNDKHHQDQEQLQQQHQQQQQVLDNKRESDKVVDKIDENNPTEHENEHKIDNQETAGIGLGEDGPRTGQLTGEADNGGIV